MDSLSRKSKIVGRHQQHQGPTSSSSASKAAPFESFSSSPVSSSSRSLRRQESSEQIKPSQVNNDINEMRGGAGAALGQATDAEQALKQYALIRSHQRTGNEALDYDDPQSHQYEEPRNVMPDPSARAGSLRRKNLPTPPDVERTNKSQLMNTKTAMNITSGAHSGANIRSPAGPMGDVDCDLRARYGSLRQGNNRPERSGSIGSSGGHRKYSALALRRDLDGHPNARSPSDNGSDSEPSSESEPCLEERRSSGAAMAFGRSLRTGGPGKNGSGRESDGNDMSPPEPAPSAPSSGKVGLSSTRSNSIQKRGGRARLGYLESECESEPPYLPTMVPGPGELINPQYIRDSDLVDYTSSKSNLDTLSTVPGSSTVTLEAGESRFLNILSNKYGKNFNYDNERIYGMSVAISGTGSTTTTNTSSANNNLEPSHQTTSEPPPPYNQTSIHYQTIASQGREGRAQPHNNLGSGGPGLGGPTPVYSSLVSQNSNSTTGPMVPMPNNLHPSQLLEPSDPPPLLRGSGYHSSTYQSHNQSAASSAFAAFAASRFNLNLGKSCSSGQHRCLWRGTTIGLILLCLLLLSVVAYKEATRSSLTFHSDDSKPCIVVEESPVGDKTSGGSASSSADSEQSGEKPPDSGQRTTESPRMSLPGSGVGSGSRSESLSTSCFASSLPRDAARFSEIKVNSPFPVSESLEPFLSWSGSFSQPLGGFLRFHFLSLPPSARLAFFAGKNEPPSLTQHELLEFINPDKPSTSKLTKRESDQTQRQGVSVELLDYFEPGSWYITIVNDAEDTVPFLLNISTASDIPTNCPNNCNGHGKCHLGKCQCFPGYIGHDCADSVCPVLCSGHGRYLQGRCHCEIGWKSLECNIRSSECEVSDCNGHGKCNLGVCQCLPGFKGEACEVADCLDPTCSSHGACIDGQCWCKTGWRGINCSEIDYRLSKFFPDCSSRGVYDLDSEKCVCFSGWLGEDCAIAKCNLDCGQQGTCEGGQCICSQGWEGSRCDRKTCDPRCLEHGQCSNGTCNCVQGWQGKHCSLNGCPFGCSSHGQCATDSSTGEGQGWRCHCREGWTGRDCSFPLETNCKDDVDNDNDGLVDCADSECCSRDECRESLMCLSAPDPLDILLRKPPPSVTASFYQKMKFLIEEGSVQSYAHRDEYSESQFWSAFEPSRVSVIRGQVVTPDGNGLTGIRISVATDPQFGFTLTRTDGWFDILVNGGSMVTLQFQRSPFHPIKRTVMVPWNEVIVIQTPIMMSYGADELYTVDASLPYHDISGQDRHYNSHHLNRSLCLSHDYQAMKPVLFESLGLGSEARSTEESVVVAESQVLQESLSMPGSGLRVVYQSSSSPGYLSTINLQLTPPQIPKALKLVHLRIVVEGNLFSQLFEAEADIKYTYAWNKRNVYRQKVYGLANARVYVGFEYSTCSQIIWTILTTTLRGFDMDISELGAWNLDIHHRYNFHQGVLQKGDGTAVYFKQQSRVASLLIGDRQPRSLMCSSHECDGLASSNRLLSPISLTNGPDGSVYVGDANLVRRVTPDGYVYTVFKNSDKSAIRGKAASTTYNYHIHLSPYDGHLYIADPERHQILRVHTVDRVDDPESNYDVFVGSGARCLPRDPNRCGDEGSALEARLSFPKGMAFGLDGTLYFADGNAIRMVNRRGLIHTIIGDNHENLKRKQWKPIPCRKTLPSEQLKLRWPTELAVHPIDGSLYFLDDQMVFRLTADHRVMVVVGVPSYCKGITVPNEPHQGTDNNWEDIGVVVSFAFGATGDMYVGAIGEDGTNRVSVYNQEGHLVHFMGIDRPKKPYTSRLDYGSRCEVETCKDINAHNCTCSVALISSPTGSLLVSDEAEGQKVVLARDTPLLSITSIAVTSDGVVHVADEGSYQIMSAVPFIPGPDEQLQFSMASPETNELYIFNKYGQHVATKNVLTGQTLYSFLYDVNTSFGKLSAVTDSSGSKVSFLRDSGNSLHSVETATGLKCRVTVNNQGFLETFVDPDNLTSRFGYEPGTGLLTSRGDSSGFTFFYHYDPAGRLTGIVKPSGVMTLLRFDFNQQGSSLWAEEATYGGSPSSGVHSIPTNPFVKVRGNEALVYYQGNPFKTSVLEDKSLEVITPWKEGLLFEAQPHKVLLPSAPVQAGMFPVLSRQINFLLNNSESRRKPSNLASIHWDYSVKYGGGAKKGFEPTPNYQSLAHSLAGIVAVERILFINETRYLSVEYDRNANREILYNNSRRPFLVIQYDNASRPIQWLPTETRLPLNVIYDRYGRLSGWQQGSAVSETFFYDRNGLLSEIRYPDATAIKFSYDEAGKTKPTKITLRSGKQYIYHYDSQGGLKKITSPRRTEHRLSLVISLGFYKLVYTPPGYAEKSNYVLHLDDHQRPIMELFPEDQGRVLYVYNSRSQLEEIVYGGGYVKKTYDLGAGSDSGTNRKERRQKQTNSAGLLLKEVWKEGDNEVLMQYYYSNSLITKIWHKVTSAYLHLSNFEFNYDYDEFGRKRSIGAKIISSSSSPSVTLPPLEYTYNTKTGRLESMANFRVHDNQDFQHHQNESLITDGTATFSKIFDSATHQLRQISLAVKDKEVYRTDLAYNANGALVTTKTFMRHLGASKVRISNFTYDSDGQLIEVAGRDQWKFAYDDNGNLATIQYMGNRIDILYDLADRVVSFGETPYQSDARGFVIQRGEERFSYNTFGLLMRSARNGRYDIRYLYDPRGRLSVRKDSYGNLTQYFYGDIERPHLVTHMFNNADGTVTTIVYDDTNMAIMAQINHETFYIACDQVGSPLLVFDHRGDVVKEIHRGPYGHVLFDSNPTLYLPVGFRGGIPEPITGLIHFHGTHIYDSLVGQWLSPNWGQVLSNLKDPGLLSLYRFSRNDPVNPLAGETRSSKLDLNRWVQHQGIDLTGFDVGATRLLMGSNCRPPTPSETGTPSYTSGALPFSCFDALLHVPTVIASSLTLPSLPLISAFWSHLLSNSRQFGVISFIQTSKVKSEELLENNRKVKLSTESVPFGYGITLTKKGERAVVYSASDADPIKRDVFTQVLNNSFLLDITLLLHGQDAFYFVKENTWKVADDLTQLQRLGSGANVTVHELKSEENSQQTEGKQGGAGKHQQVDVRLHVRGAIVNIRYGTTAEKEKVRVLRHAKKQAISERWSRERDLILSNQLTDNYSASAGQNWNEAEKELILSSGSVPGYRGDYDHPPDSYPQLADDQSNIVFSKHHSKPKA